MESEERQRKMGATKEDYKRGRWRAQGSLRESTGSNQFGHRKEMEPLGIDNAALYSWGGEGRG